VVDEAESGAMGDCAGSMMMVRVDVAGLLALSVAT